MAARPYQNTSWSPRNSLEATSVRATGTPGIVAESASRIATPVSNVPIPSVVMNELTPTRTTSTAVTSPIAVQTISVARTASPSGHPCSTASTPISTCEKATMPAMERSNSFTASVTVSPIATRSSTAWLPRIDCAFALVKKLFGSSAENSAISRISAQTIE